MRTNRLVSALGVAIFLVTLVAVGALSRDGVVRSFRKIKGGWRNFIVTMRNELPKCVAFRNDWIDFNGYVMRALDRRVSNRTMRYNGDILAGQSHLEVDVRPLVDSIVKMRDLLRTNDIPYLFALAPCKLDRALEMLPSGTDPAKHGIYRSGDELVAGLRCQAIEVCDLTHGLTDDLEQVGRNFYRTDHHWRYEAVFSVFPRIARQIASMAGQELPDDLPEFDPQNWERVELKGNFLGSQGRRTGVGFAGKDDFIYFLPKFPTEIEYAQPTRRLVKRGDFREAIVCGRLTDPGLSSYEGSRYSVFGGEGDYLRRIIHSASAPCSLKVLIIKDSYAVPVIGFLATVFSDLEVVDPRDFKQPIGTYILGAKPDVVLTFVNLKSMYSPDYFFPHNWVGAPAYASKRLGDIVVGASDSHYHYHKAKASLKPGRRYRLCLSGLTLSEGEAQGQVSLYDRGAKKRLESRIWQSSDIADGLNTWEFSVPKNVTKPEMLFYAGIAGKTEGRSATYKDVVLEELNR